MHSLLQDEVCLKAVLSGFQEDHDVNRGLNYMESGRVSCLRTFVKGYLAQTPRENNASDSLK